MDLMTVAPMAGNWGERMAEQKVYWMAGYLGDEMAE